MRWTRLAPLPEPQQYAKRSVLLFAVVPVRLEEHNGRVTWVWLEWYVAQQEYTLAGYGWKWQTIARYSPEVADDLDAQVEEDDL